MSVLKMEFGQIADARRGQGRMYDLPHVLLFCLLASAAEATTLRRMAAFIERHLPRLREVFGCRWRRAPSHTPLYTILRGVDGAQLEAAMRRHAAQLQAKPDGAAARWHVAMDGKTLRGSLERLADRPAAQVLTAFAVGEAVVLGQLVMEDGDKDSQIAAVQRLIQDLGISGAVISLDALHLQKKRLNSP